MLAEIALIAPKKIGEKISLTTRFDYFQGLNFTYKLSLLDHLENLARSGTPFHSSRLSPSNRIYIPLGSCGPASAKQTSMLRYSLDRRFFGCPSANSNKNSRIRILHL